MSIVGAPAVFLLSVDQPGVRPAGCNGTSQRPSYPTLSQSSHAHARKSTESDNDTTGSSTAARTDDGL
eukprot:m.461719 g.461719  ORF g.461719 m.461719 type:complete len:68 (-) comp21599_c1_seq2:1042-1245(-)